MSYEIINRHEVSILKSRSRNGLETYQALKLAVSVSGSAGLVLQTLVFSLSHVHALQLLLASIKDQ